jgi:hypothetical protein
MLNDHRHFFIVDQPSNTPNSQVSAFEKIVQEHFRKRNTHWCMLSYKLWVVTEDISPYFCLSPLIRKESEVAAFSSYYSMLFPLQQERFSFLVNLEKDVFVSFFGMLSDNSFPIQHRILTHCFGCLSPQQQSYLCHLSLLELCASKAFQPLPGPEFSPLFRYVLTSPEKTRHHFLCPLWAFPILKRYTDISLRLDEHNSLIISDCDS